MHKATAKENVNISFVSLSRPWPRKMDATVAPPTPNKKPRH